MAGQVPINTSSPARSASFWAAALDGKGEGIWSSLTRVYGTAPEVLDARIALLRKAVTYYLESFGDHPIRIFRSPGRINLRGMHVDTHGGYVNLMTHQREIVVVASPRNDGRVQMAHADPAWKSVDFDPGPYIQVPSFRDDWSAFIQDARVSAGKSERGCGDWGNYVAGAVLSAMHRIQESAPLGMQGVVAGDTPQGAGLSSSSALCTAVLLAALGIHNQALSVEEAIQAVQDAEWFAGARIGVCDQAAMLLGRQGSFVNAALYRPRLETASARAIPLPPHLRVLVVNSHTTRNLSGAQLVDYARNRFAYSIALDILRQELVRTGIAKERAGQLERLSDFAPERLTGVLGTKSIWDLLRTVPEALSVDELRTRYDLPGIDRLYNTYFGIVPPAEQPTSFELRGPLLYGIAESERGRLFPELVESGRDAEAGKLMTIGHDGDRRVRQDGAVWEFDVSDTAIEAYKEAGTDVAWCPGAYGASSPALDMLVDTAVASGALGASLTGAGIAGSILAFCTEADVPAVRAGLRACLQATDYAHIAGLPRPLTTAEAKDAVVENCAPAGAGELALE